MDRDFRRKVGEQFGPWLLIKPLGRGGNAEVWEVRNGNTTQAALKILNSRKPDSEPYKRFKAEIELLQSLGSWPGVLPVIDAYLPEHPNPQNPGWIAMPVCIGIREALEAGEGLSRVVEAIAGIADVLVSLASKGISHRDIKPDNLYQYQNRWVIGDFGLADYPNKETITAEGQKLGPLWFIAPEMLSNPQDADGSLADVYSLSKTLWVLATGQKYPPQGEQRIDVPQIRLSSYISYPRTNLLDRLIEHATKYDPKARPNMQQFASELHAWLAPQTEIASPGDLSDLLKRIRVAADPIDRAEQLQREHIALGKEAIEKIRARMTPIAESFARTGRSDGTIENKDAKPFAYKYYHHHKGTYPVYELFYEAFVLGEECLTITATTTRQRPHELVCEVKVILYKDGMLEMHALYWFNALTWPPGLPDFDWHIYYFARVGSAKQEQVIDWLMNELMNNLRPALECFAGLLESIEQSS